MVIQIDGDTRLDYLQVQYWAEEIGIEAWDCHSDDMKLGLPKQTTS